MASELCSDVYCDRPHMRGKHGRATFVRLDTNDSGQDAVITHSGGMICVVFRGSVDKWDLRLDLNVYATDFFTINGTPAGKMHGGFVERFNFLKWIILYPLRGMARRHPRSKILLTGHSLGGALAILMAVWIHEVFTNKLVVCVFGCPRTGNREFYEYCSQTHVLNSRCILVQAECDPITFLPYHFGVWFHPVCRMLLIRRDGRLVTTMIEPTKLCHNSLKAEFWSFVTGLSPNSHRMAAYRLAVSGELPNTLSPSVADEKYFQTPQTR